MAETKKISKLADLLNTSRTVQYTEDEVFEVRPLTLTEMIQFFLDASDDFLPLYAAGLEGLDQEKLFPFLLKSPMLVAKIIALASGNPSKAEEIQNRMPATVQLIALSEIWKASVPDPKAAQRMLSEVTALLRMLHAKEKIGSKGAPQIFSPTTS